MSRNRWACAALALSCSACFHQNVHTGLAPSATVIDKPWVSTWLWGLVQAQPIAAGPFAVPAEPRHLHAATRPRHLRQSIGGGTARRNRSRLAG